MGFVDWIAAIAVGYLVIGRLLFLIIDCAQRRTAASIAGVLLHIALVGGIVACDRFRGTGFFVLAFAAWLVLGSRESVLWIK